MKNRIRHLSVALISASLCLGAAAHAAPAKKSDPPAGGYDREAKMITGSQEYMSMFGLRASIAEGFSIAGYLSVDAGINIPDAKLLKQARAIRPRLNDAMRQALASYVSSPYMMGATPDLRIIRGRMQRAVDKHLGKGNSTVLLASVILFPE